MKKIKKHKHLISAYIVSFVAVAFTLLPVTWLFMLSIKSKGETFTKPPKWIFDPTINNYIKLWDNDLFKDTFFNSIFITLISIVLSVTIALFAAYALKRYQIKFKTAFMQWLLLAYMLPEFLFVLPMFAIYQTLGIYDTYLGMAIIYQVHVLPFSIWMLRSFLEEIPKEIDDAAIIDGCGPLQAIYRIYLPLIIPGIVATAILNGIWVWNELAIALGLTFFDAQPITVGVASFRGYASIDWGGMTGSAIISIIPMVLFAAFAQKHIVKGLTLGSVKG
ncbi:MAG: Trehalose transport system permease protein SugB [Alphaproteobacteria bacterium MarineAlpha5_Bin5]|nr:MAG: Trehalose transport system permease protein SugB [Alphaproteobacteria bacterium MarineAlpha5_Bin5]|tara:strand:+ start:1450 stop:2280 length:831 start_codon:yes stop_codon:yes gene_type:complete